MRPFDYLIPVNPEEASAILRGSGSEVCPLQGGTDLLLRLQAGAIRPAAVLDLKHLPGMRDISETPEGWLRIGSACTMNQVAQDPRVRQGYSLLARACEAVASYQLRNRATLGGNCCNASPAADTAPALYCLEAVAEIYGIEGTRSLAIGDFFVGPGRTALGPGEFLMAVHLPPPREGAAGSFNKLGRTRVGDIAVVSVAVYAVPADGSYAWRIALGAVGPTPMRATEAETEAARLVTAGAAGVGAVAEMASRQAAPITDLRAGATYRAAMVQVLTRRGIESVLAATGQGLGAKG